MMIRHSVHQTCPKCGDFSVSSRGELNGKPIWKWIAVPYCPICNQELPNDSVIMDGKIAEYVDGGWQIKRKEEVAPEPVMKILKPKKSRLESSISFLRNLITKEALEPPQKCEDCEGYDEPLTIEQRRKILNDGEPGPTPPECKIWRVFDPEPEEEPPSDEEIIDSLVVESERKDHLGYKTGISPDKCSGCSHYRLPGTMNAVRWCIHDDGTSNPCKSHDDPDKKVENNGKQ